jgi:3'-5' exonuclease
VDTVNTFLLHLRFQLVKGILTREQYRAESALVKTYLQGQGKPHWQEFLKLWNAP